MKRNRLDSILHEVTILLYFFYLCVYLLNREIKSISYCELQLRNMDLDDFFKMQRSRPHTRLSNQGKYGLDSTFLASTKGALHTFKLRVTGDDDVEPLKDNKHNSEMIHTGFRRLFLDVGCINCQRVIKTNGDENSGG